MTWTPRFSSRGFSNRKRRRRGTATLEFVLATPLFLFLFAALFSIFVAGASFQYVQLDARWLVWSARFDAPPAQGVGLSGSSRLGRLAGVPTDSGLIRSTVEKDVRFVAILSRQTFRAHATREVLAGSSTWDHTQMPVPRRAPMQLDPRFSAVLSGY